MLFEPAGDGAHEVLAAPFAFPVVRFPAGGAGRSDVVRGFLKDDFRHGGSGEEYSGVLLCVWYSNLKIEVGFLRWLIFFSFLFWQMETHDL